MKNIKGKTFGHLVGMALVLCCLFILPSSCNKQGTDQEAIEAENTAAAAQEETQQVKYIYLLDSREVKEGTFDPEDERLFVDITGEKDPAVTGGGIIKIWAFSSEELYLAWGDLYGMPVRCALEMERHFAAYAESSGAVAHYERTGEVLPEYQEYIDRYYFESSCGGNGGAVERGTGLLYRHTSGGGSHLVVGPTPVMWPTWNNEVSRYVTWGLYDGLKVYNRSFFNRRLATLWNWGWNEYTFTGSLGYLNDRMSSVIILF